MGCTDFIVKYILFVANFLVTVIGLVIVGLGSLVINYMNGLSEFVPNDNKTIAVTVTVFGCFIFIVAFFGCCGAIAEKPILLITYTVCLLILSALKMYVVVKLYVIISNIETVMEEFLIYIFNSPETRDSFFIVEVLYNCCGPSGAKSYIDLELPLPPNCCRNFELPVIDSIEDVYLVQAVINAYNDTDVPYCGIDETFTGCKNTTVSTVYMWSNGLANVCMIIIFVELVATVFALYLAQHYRNVKECSGNLNQNLTRIRLRDET